MLLLDGTAQCDRCGRPLPNGGVHDALVLTDLRFDTGEVKQYHLCRVYGGFNDNLRCCDTALDQLVSIEPYPRGPDSPPATS